MAVIVNHPSNLPITILSTHIEQFIKSGISPLLLDEVTCHPNMNIGIKRESYYVIKTDVTIRHASTRFDRECKLLRIVLDICITKGFQSIMIKF